MNSTKLKQTIQLLVLLHFFSNAVHLSAHFYHGVPTVFITNIMGKIAGHLFILLFFIVFPLVAAWQLKNRQEPQCYYLLAVAMAPSWTYAFLYHFILNTSDYVCLFGATLAGRWFSWSAYSISFVDAALFIFSIYAIFQVAQSKNRPQY